MTREEAIRRLIEWAGTENWNRLTEAQQNKTIDSLIRLVAKCGEER